MKKCLRLIWNEWHLEGLVPPRMDHLQGSFLASGTLLVAQRRGQENLEKQARSRSERSHPKAMKADGEPASPDPGPVLAAQHPLALILGTPQVPLCQQNPRYSNPREGRNEQINRIDES